VAAVLADVQRDVPIARHARIVRLADQVAEHDVYWWAKRHLRAAAESRRLT